MDSGASYYCLSPLQSVLGKSELPILFVPATDPLVLRAIFCLRVLITAQLTTRPRICICLFAIFCHSMLFLLPIHLLSLFRLSSAD